LRAHDAVTTVNKVAAIANEIEGWLSEQQGRALFAAAANCSGRGAIVEIGSWKGRSTTWLASGARTRGLKIYAVDPHEGSREDPVARTFDAFIANVSRAGVLESIHPLMMTSAAAVEAVKGPVELLFLDADHSIAGASRDADLWLARVMTGGTVMLHDVATSGYSGPRRVFQQRICRSPEFHRIRRVGSMAIAERTCSRSAAQSLRARVFDARLYLYDVEGAIKRTLRRVRRLRLHTAPPSAT
jgi:predicted O-methyltransferase YrrM